MNEEFPIIKTIDDVLPWIADKPEITIQEKSFYDKKFKIICYQISDKNTFDNPYARECRGIVFDSSGKIVCRPFHKFFNVNEREETQEKSLNDKKISSIHPKMDGSMISWFNSDGIWIPKTKKTFFRPEITGALKTNEYTSGSIDRLLDSIGPEYTATFEYTSPTNRIVVDYKEPHLTLLAIRHNESGEYVPYNILKIFAEAAKCSYVQNINGKNIEFLLNKAKETKTTEIEGWVAVFDSGERVKIKTVGYLMAHKLIGSLTMKNILETWAEEQLDDRVSFLRSNGFFEQANEIEKIGQLAKMHLIETINLIKTSSDNLLKRKYISPETFFKDSYQELQKQMKNPAYINATMRLLRGQEVDWNDFTKKVVTKEILEELNKGTSDFCQPTRIGFGERQ